MGHPVIGGKERIIWSDGSRLRDDERDFAACDIRRGNSEPQFEIDIWTTTIEEQRQRIALAAGVDPSKVRILIGH